MNTDSCKDLFSQNFKISNLGIPVSFSGLRRGNGHSQMAGLRQDQEEDIPECSGWEKSGSRENGIRNADL